MRAIAIAVAIAACAHPQPAPHHIRVPTLTQQDDEITVSWVGHATCLVGIRGHWFLTDPNFADRIAGGPPFETQWSARAQLRTTDVEAMQKQLTRLGLYSDKVDGKAGMKTRAALGAWQKTAGVKVDCWPDAALLQSMRR